MPTPTTDHRPAGFRAVTPYLVVHGAERLLVFLRDAFGAEVVDRTDVPGGGIMHSAIRIGDSMLELSEANERWPARRASIHLYVPDADATYARAVAAGATSLYEPADRPYGDRESGVEDPCGNHWFVATHVEDVPREELRRRMAAAR